MEYGECVVLEGRVQVNKGALIMSVLEPGDLFGAAALFNDRADYATTLTARAPCRVLLLPQALVEELMVRFPEVGRNYVAYLSGRICFLSGKIDALTAGSAERKVAQYLLSRLEGGEYLLQREKVDLYASLSGLLAAFYNDFTDRGFDMEVELAEGLPQVWADAGAVLRIFTNLIRNALEHGEGRMEIRLYQEGGQVVSRFSNETHALTAEDVPHVFDRFFTSDKMRTGRNTGLGLAIVKALAGQMDCRAEAALEGDMFAITLRWPVERR